MGHGPGLFDNAPEPKKARGRAPVTHPTIPPAVFYYRSGGPAPSRRTAADEVSADLDAILSGERVPRERLARTLEYGIYLLAQWELEVLARCFRDLIDRDREPTPCPGPSKESKPT